MQNKIDPGTIARTVFLVITLINIILKGSGKLPLEIAEDAIYTFVSDAMLILSTILAWWKNNSFTEKALEADAVLKVNKLKESK